MLSINAIKGIILDMDGVLWRGPLAIGNLSDIFMRLNEHKWHITLATNNATLTIFQYVDRLKSYGVIVEPWQIITSAIATAKHLHTKFPEGGPVFIIGEEGVKEPLRELGFFHSEKQVLAVVASMDRYLTYDKLRMATILIRNGAYFVATNPDRTYPSPEGLIPGAGSIVAALEAACYQSPVITGKPSPTMYRIALERMGLVPDEALVVGDRAETDIAGAQLIGCKTALVLSGVTSKEEAHNWQPSPDIIIDDLDAISRL